MWLPAQSPPPPSTKTLNLGLVINLMNAHPSFPVLRFSVAELRALLISHNVDISKCIEKKDLENLVTLPMLKNQMERLCQQELQKLRGDIERLSCSDDYLLGCTDQELDSLETSLISRMSKVRETQVMGAIHSFIHSFIIFVRMLICA